MRKLTDVGREQTAWSVPIRDAAFPAPFASELEFNAPVHGTWNIVHTGMLVPEAQQIYVCAANCMRGVVLTAAEMNAADRFSYVILEEQDLIRGDVEAVTIQGVADVIRRLPKRPPAVMLYTVCLHHFLGCDLEHIYRTLEAEFPDIFFARCYMDPIMRKNGLTPDQKTRNSMYEPLQPRPVRPGTVSVLGGDFALDETCDLTVLLRENGYTLRQIQDCRTYEEFLALAEGEWFLSTYPNGKYGAGRAAKRVGRPHLYLPACFGYEEITAHLTALAQTLGLPVPDTAPAIRRCEAALKQARQAVGETPVSIDYTFHTRPLGLARLLLEHGFRVDTVYVDAMSGEERADFDWLRENAPDLCLTATVQVGMRVQPRKNPGLALGQKAAWFTGTAHFVNLVEGAGLYGFDGICRLAALIEEAMAEAKDTEDLVPRKGLGCDSCI